MRVALSRKSIGFFLFSKEVTIFCLRSFCSAISSRYFEDFHLQQPGQLSRSARPDSQISPSRS